MADQELEQALARADQLAKEVEFYKTELNDLGGRLVRAREEQRRSVLEATRQKNIARYRGDVERWVNQGPSLEHYRAEVLAAIAGIFMADHVVMLRHSHVGHQRFVVMQAMGSGTEYPETLEFKDEVPAQTYSSSTNTSEDAAGITNFLAVPFILWVHNPAARVALAVGCVRETNVCKAFEPEDLEVLQGLQEAYLDGLARLSKTPSTDAVRRAGIGQGVTEFEIRRYFEDVPRSRILRAIVVERPEDGVRGYVAYLELSWSAGHRVMRTKASAADKRWQEIRRCIHTLRDEYGYQAAIVVMTINSPELPSAIRERELLLQAVDVQAQPVDAPDREG